MFAYVSFNKDKELLLLSCCSADQSDDPQRCSTMPPSAFPRNLLKRTSADVSVSFSVAGCCGSTWMAGKVKNEMGVIYETAFIETVEL